MASITLALNDTEQNALRQLLDISLRQAGLYALDVVSHFNARLNEAAQATITGHSSAEPHAALKAATAAASAAPAAPTQAVAASAASQPAAPAGTSPAGSDPASKGRA